MFNFGVGWKREMSMRQIFTTAVAVAVSATPEGPGNSLDGDFSLGNATDFEKKKPW